MKYLIVMISLFVISCGLIPNGERYHTDECINCEPDNSTSSNSEILEIFRS